MSALPFTRFCSQVLDVQLTPGQSVLCRVAFDGLDPCELSGDDRELARAIFGDVDVIPPEARHVLAALCGARAGKSYVLAALRALHLSLTVDLSSMAPGETASAVIVAPDIRLARQVLRYVSGAVEATPSISALVTSETADAITLRRPDGAHVAIECLPATRGGSAVRGRTLACAVLDEAAFFRDSDYQVNDGELFKAVAPRVVPTGQVIIASTPWAETGLLHEMYTRNHGSPVDAIAAHAPTLLLRDDEHTRRLVKRERERDSDNCEREFDAQPMSAGAAEFFSDCIAPSITDEVDVPLHLREASALGVDTAFRRDPSTAIVASRSRKDRVISVVDSIEIRPTRGKHLVPSETIAALLDRGDDHRVHDVVADIHYVDTLKELAAERDRYIQVIEAPGGQTGKVDTYTIVRRAMREGKVRIPATERRLLAQLRQVVAKPTPGGGLSISIPRRGGAHGDLVSAFVLAVWRLADKDSLPLSRNPVYMGSGESEQDRAWRARKNAIACGWSGDVPLTQKQVDYFAPHRSSGPLNPFSGAFGDVASKFPKRPI